MSDLLGVCCCGGSGCSGSMWTCSTDLVEFDITVHHKITAARDVNLQMRACCREDPTNPTCDETDGERLVTSTPMAFSLEYECRFKVYMTPPSGENTNPWNLGEWVQTDTCAAEWLVNPTMGGRGPQMSGSWTGVSHFTMSEVCAQSAGTDCYPISGNWAYPRRTEVGLDVSFSYEHPEGENPPSEGLLGIIKRRHIPTMFNANGNSSTVCCRDLSQDCISRCLIDLQVGPGIVTPVLGGDGLSEINTPYANVPGPDCELAGRPDFSGTYSVADCMSPVGFHTGARMVYEGEGVNVCDPPLAGTEVASVYSEIGTSWSNLLSMMENAAPDAGFNDSISAKCIEAMNCDSGFGITANNGSPVHIGASTFYNETMSNPCVDCVVANTELGYCDPTGSAGVFDGTGIPSSDSNYSPCDKFERNFIDGITDHIWQYSYHAHFAYCDDWNDFQCFHDTGGTQGPCGSLEGRTIYWPEDTHTDDVNAKLKTTVTVNSVTAVNAQSCQP